VIWKKSTQCGTRITGAQDAVPSLHCEARARSGAWRAVCFLFGRERRASGERRWRRGGIARRCMFCLASKALGSIWLGCGAALGDMVRQTSYATTLITRILR